MGTRQAERDRRGRLLVWLMAAPTILAVVGLCAIEAWHLVALLTARP